MKRNIYTAVNELLVSVAHGIERWDNTWTFVVEGMYWSDKTKQVLQVKMTRAEALRLRRQLNVLLKATAPPRKRAR